MTDLQPRETVHRQTVYEGPLITLRKDTIRRRDGRVDTHEVVVHPEVVVILPVLDDGRIVLVRQYRGAVESVLLELPA